MAYGQQIYGTIQYGESGVLLPAATSFGSPFTVNDLQSKIALSLDLSSNPPSVDSSEWNLRLGFINRALSEWALKSEWFSLAKEFKPSISQNQASLGLPNGFRKAYNVKLYDIEGGRQFKEIKSEETQHYDSQEEYFYITGNESDGFGMTWNPPFTSTASVIIQYYSAPTLVSTASEAVFVPDPEFLVNRIVGFVLETRSDSGFQISENRAVDNLGQMVDNETYKSRAYTDRVMNSQEVRYPKFRIGK